MNKGKIILKGESGKDYGYLKYKYKDTDGIEHIVSLNIKEKIKKKWFDKKLQRIKNNKSIPYSIRNINELIDTYLSKYDKHFETLNKERTLLSSIAEITKLITNNSTRRTYTTLSNLLAKFIKEKYIDSSDIKLDDIDIFFIKKFKKYLLTECGYHNNSAYVYLNRLKAIFRKIEKDDLYTFNPRFYNIKIKPVKSKKTALELNELFKLNYYYIDNSNQRNYNLSHTRNMFLFQINCNGVRISDLLKMKWGDISLSNDITDNNDDRLLIYIDPVKTGNPYTVEFNNDMILLLAPFLPKNSNTVFINNELKAIDKGQLKFKTDKTKKEDLKLYIDLLAGKLYLNVIKAIIEIVNNEKYNNKFIFNYLNTDFEAINNYRQLSDIQHYTLMQKRITYNRHLNLIAKQLKINKNITSHVGRHTFASLIVNYDPNYDIVEVMKALNQSSIRITEGYLSELDTKKRPINQNISDITNRRLIQSTDKGLKRIKTNVKIK